MNLERVNVLVDGYNLRLAQGTGIKSYGVSLIQALTCLNANVSVLVDSKNLNEGKLRKKTLGEKANLIQKFFKGINFFWSNPHQVIDSDFTTEYKSVYQFNDLYDLCLAVDKRVKYKKTINFPDKIEVWHCTYPLPIQVRGAKKITTIHDLIPLKLPSATLDNQKYFTRRIKEAIRESGIIITVSESSKRDLLDFFDVKSEQIHVTYSPSRLASVSMTEEEVYSYLDKYNLNYKQYLLFVGAIEPKKNLGRLLEAFAKIDVNMPLAIAGQKGWLWEKDIEKLEKLFGDESTRKVRLMNYVTLKELVALYRGAYCLIFPSLYEGFGLPPLEAMSFGCPVITSEVSSLPEVCGDAALYVNPYDTDDIKDKIEMLLNNPQLCTDLARKGQKRAEFFSLENYCQQLYNAYSSAIS